MGLYVCERKTTTKDIGLGSPYWTILILDPQIPVYLDGVRSLGYDPRGVLYDVLRVPQLKPLKASASPRLRHDGKPYANSRMKDETPEEFGKRVLAAIVESPNRYYQRGTVVRLEKERADAALDVWQTASAIRDSHRLNVWPRNPDSCLDWFRPCEYLSVCAGFAAHDDPLLFKVQDRQHEGLGSDVPRDGQSLLLLTQSSLRTYRSCARKYQFRYEMRLRSVAPKDEKLRRGSSLHRALEWWSRTGGDIDAALYALDREDLYAYERERAMMIGYHARWGDCTGKATLVEHEFRMPLVNPETGASSRTFELGGKVDVLYEIADDEEFAKGADVQSKILLEQLERSIARD